MWGQGGVEEKGGADRDAPLRMLILAASPKDSGGKGGQSERKMIRRAAADIVRWMETLTCAGWGNSSSVEALTDTCGCVNAPYWREIQTAGASSQ